MAQLALNPQLDVEAISREYRANGRVRIPHFMAEAGARSLHAHLVSRQDWRTLFIGEQGIVELHPDARAALSAAAARTLDEAIHARATLGFQYRYEGLRVPPPDATTTDALSEFAKFMASAPLLAFLGKVVDRDDIAFSEGQATAYAPGDFLTGHDDAVPGRGRLAAFVLGMTPQWRPEWGGLLCFHDADDSRVVGHVPRWNTLDIFAVPQRHSVSHVNASAPGRRLSLTGWMRTLSI